MSAEILRDAAKVLRERAEAATPGPWYWEPESSEEWPSGDQSLRSSGQKMRSREGVETEWDDTVLVGWGYDASGIEGRREDRDYIATMHPGVGLALADWLAEEADAIDDWDPDGGALDAYLAQAAVMRVARAILGGTT